MYKILESASVSNCCGGLFCSALQMTDSRHPSSVVFTAFLSNVQKESDVELKKTTTIKSALKQSVNL